jgi:GNAT superfamily N-acetyltransferase
MMGYNLELVHCGKQYWEFVRVLRMDKRVLDGFIEKVEITPEQQIAYMTKYSDCFRIALSDNEPVGYFGVIEDDIRICVHPDYQKKGIGKFLVNSCFEIWPNALAKIKITNQSSQKLFESCGYVREYFLYKKN